MKAYIAHVEIQLPDHFERKLISEEDNMYGNFGILAVDAKDPLFPARSDLKIMRTDVSASIVLLRKMLEKSSFSDAELSEMSLYVANGAFLKDNNKHMDRILKAYRKMSEIEGQTARQAFIFKNIPPLLALETLTNSTMSFISQYSQIKGNNTTFGNTSYSSYIAVKEASRNIYLNNTKHAMAVGANGSGVFSALYFQNFFEQSKGWMESACTASVLLQKSRDDCNVRIKEFAHDKRVPSLSQTFSYGNWSQFFDQSHKVDGIVYSGGFTEDQFSLNRNEVKKLSDNIFSYNDEYGNLGASSMMASIRKGVEWITEGICKKVAILDRDPYGRETCIYLEKS